MKQNLSQNRLDLLQKLFIYFVLYSCIGWLYEVFLEVVIYQWGFSNRGFLFGPYCIIYGFGALVLIFSLRQLQEQRLNVGKVNVTPLLIFLAIVVITTVIELIGSYIMEFFTGGWMWDYTRYAFDFEGRIAPNPSFRFGLGGMFFLYICQPLFEKLTHGMSKNCLHLCSGLLAVVFAVDLVYTLLIK